MRTARPGALSLLDESASGSSSQVHDTFNIPSPSLRLKVANIQSLSGIVASVSSGSGESKNQRHVPAFAKGTLQKLGFFVKFIQIGVR
jgi:hypothetical protein